MTTPEAHARYRTALEAEQERIAGELADLGLGAEGDLSYDPNFADTSQVTAERGEAQLLASELSETLENVNQALLRIDDGTYGTCTSCGSAISDERLNAMPFASLCIACASRS